MGVVLDILCTNASLFSFKCEVYCTIIDEDKQGWILPSIRTYVSPRWVSSPVQVYNSVDLNSSTTLSLRQVKHSDHIVLLYHMLLSSAQHPKDGDHTEMMEQQPLGSKSDD